MLSPFSASSSQEEDAIKKCLHALTETQNGKTVIKNAERKLYIHKIPKGVKDLAPVLQVIIERRIVVKWEF